MDPIALSIVIVNYNGGVLLENCLTAIYDDTLAFAFEVIILDNGSIDHSIDCVAEKFPQVQLIRIESNLGFCKAFNRGLNLAKGRYVLSLDNDTRVLPGSLEHMVSFLQEHPRAGAVGGGLLNPDMTPQQAARGVPSAWNALFGRRSILTRIFPQNPFTKHYLMADHRDSLEPFEVDWHSLAAFMVRREVLESAGRVDEDFFVYWSDADWSKRIRDAGWKIFSLPRAQVIHDERMARTKGRQSTRMVIDFHRGAYCYYRKHVAKSRWNPMALLAFAGLSLRAGAIIAYGYGADMIDSLARAVRG